MKKIKKIILWPKCFMIVCKNCDCQYVSHVWFVAQNFCILSDCRTILNPDLLLFYTVLKFLMFIESNKLCSIDLFAKKKILFAFQANNIIFLVWILSSKFVWFVSINSLKGFFNTVMITILALNIQTWFKNVLQGRLDFDRNISRRLSP